MSDTDTLVHGEARVATHLPQRYLTQLCKHFEHKLPVTLEGASGRIDFSHSVCALRADEAPGTLVLRVSAASEEALRLGEDVIARHLLRFAFREDMRIEWK